MAAPSVAVTTLPTPLVGAADFRGALSAGGSIPNGQSRWYRLVAMDASSVGAVRRHSVASAEIGPFTAGGGNNRVVLNWSANGGGTAAYRVYVRTDATPNPSYNESTPNALGAVASVSFSTTTTGLTFTDSGAIVCTRPFFPLGIVRAVLTQGDAGNPGTFRTFYDAIVAASPANAGLLIPATFSPDIIGNYFQLAAYLELGISDGTPFYFVAKDSCVFVVGGFRCIAAPGSGSTLIWGEFDAATGRRSRGSALYLAGYGSALRSSTTNGPGRGLFYADGVSELNDSYVEDIGRRGMIAVTGNGMLSGGSDTAIQFGNDGNNFPITLRGTEIAGLATWTNATGQLVTSTVRDAFVRGCYGAYTYSVSNVSFDNLTIEDSDVGLFTRLPSGVTHRFTNLRVLGRTECDIAYQATGSPGHALLRDAIFGDAADDEDPLVKQVGSVVGSTLEWESLVEVEVIDAAGAPVSGRAVSILDSAGAVLASGVTDASGVVVGGLAVSYLLYASLVTGALAAALMSAHVAAAKWSKTDRRPLTLRVDGAAGQEAFSLPFSPTGSVDYLVKLHHDNTAEITGIVEPIEIAGVVARSDIEWVVEEQGVGAGVTTLEDI